MLIPSPHPLPQLMTAVVYHKKCILSHDNHLIHGTVFWLLTKMKGCIMFDSIVNVGPVAMVCHLLNIQGVAVTQCELWFPRLNPVNAVRG